MRNPDILKQTNFQSRIIPIDFAGYPERIMLAGCPVNAKGQFANDGSAIGILVEDVRREYAYGEIAVAGFVDYEIAQNHAGISYTKECMTALKNIVFEGVGDKWVAGAGEGSSGGGTVKSVNSKTPDEAGNVAIAYDDLEGKPFYEETVEYIDRREYAGLNIPISYNPSDFSYSYADLYYVGETPLEEDVTYDVTLADGAVIPVTFTYIYKSYDGTETEHQNYYIHGQRDITIYSARATDYYFSNEGGPIKLPYVGVYAADNVNIISIKKRELKTLDEKFLPKASAIADVAVSPTAAEFNALLAALRAAGYMAE